MTTLDSNTLATTGVLAFAVGVGGAFGNWWITLALVGVALLVGAYAASVRESETTAGPFPAPDEQPAREQPAAARVPNGKPVIL